VPTKCSTTGRTVTISVTRYPRTHQLAGRFAMRGSLRFSVTGGYDGIAFDDFFYAGILRCVAESGGRIAGSSGVDEREIIAGIGPITVTSAVQNLGVGRKLMEAVMDHTEPRGAAGTRLVQAASCLHGRPLKQSAPGCKLGWAQPDDMDQCNSLARRVHQCTDSIAALIWRQTMNPGTATVVDRGARVTGYASPLGPLRWCLGNGLWPMTLMSARLYSEPAGGWLPSAVF